MMIKSKLITGALLATVLVHFSCEKESLNQTSNDIEPDTSPPIITTTTNNKLIETPSEITYRISDDSKIASLKILINAKPFDREAEETIKINIDPFDHPDGQMKIKVIAEDEHGNVQEITDIFQIKKLLLRIPTSNILDPYYMEHYVLINSSAGDLVKVVKIKPYEDVSVYATEGFQDQKFTASLFSYTNDLNPNNYCKMYSYENIERGTILPALESIRQEGNYVDYPDIDSSLDFSIAPVALGNPVLIGGNGYWNELLQENETKLRYSSSIDPNFLVRSVNTKSADTSDSFKYFWINNLMRTSYGAEEFLVPESFVEIQIPSEMKSQTQGNFTCRIQGYGSKQDYIDRKGHDIISLSTANINVFKDGLIVPEISEFKLYDKMIAASVGNGYTWWTKQKGLEFKTLPEMTLRHIDDQIVASGDFDEIFFEYGSYHLDDSTFISFNWIYYTVPEEQIAIPFGRFEIPQEIEEILLERNIKSKNETNDGTGSSVSLVNIGNYTNYSNRLFEHNWYYAFPEWSRLELNLNN